MPRRKLGTESLKGLTSTDLIQGLISSVDKKYLGASIEESIDQWVEGVKLPSGPFSFAGHEYQRGMVMSKARRRVSLKGSQMGISQIEILASLYGMLKRIYPLGVLYLFPTEKDVYDFSRARFSPLLTENPDIAKEVRDTDSVSLKRIHKALLYLRGARSTSKIEGARKMSTQLLSIPVDRVVFDELDNMDQDMIELALKRMGHSEVKEEVYLGTPSVPGHGVSKLYDESDQRVWEIKCQHCGAGIVLELEFPDCLKETKDGIIRGCKKCGKEVFPHDGQWVVREASRTQDMAGFWISRLNSPYSDLKDILSKFNDPSSLKKQELYNSELAMPYVPAENKLSMSDVYSRCGMDPMALSHSGPCAMGVDVGRVLNVVIGFKPKDKQLQICKMARVSGFNDVHDLAKRFNVKCAVIDMEPELRKAREFADAEPYRVFLCDYQDTIVSGPNWDEEKKTVKVNRTETCDATHDLINSDMLILPRRNEEVELFAKHCSNIVKVLEEDTLTGSKTFKYRKTGDDHYRHTLNYFWIASKKIGVSKTDEDRLLEMMSARQADYDPLTYGLNEPLYVQ